MATRASRHPAYSQARGACLRRSLGRLAATAAALALGLACAGCSYSYKLGSLLGEEKEAALAAATPAPSTTPAAPAREADLAFAKAAAAELLARGKDTSAPWENPATGARGAVTPLATSYTKDGFVCRDFLTSHVAGDKESWYQGGACRVHGGRWEVRDIRPLQRT